MIAYAVSHGDNVNRHTEQRVAYISDVSTLSAHLMPFYKSSVAKHVRALRNSFLEVKMITTRSMSGAGLLFLLFSIANAVDPKIVCDKEFYGDPSLSDCVAALHKYPAVKTAQYFVEEQLRTVSQELLVSYTSIFWSS